ncbi:tRNA pseudouridine(38-40) synthase TruA [Gehongia tenuis]|uniref:tRNA pseudouridine synthase A n=1 Tax=Gehongia tenuis TaxID=2763655 RepID=A0A926HQT5_9FIRM|nr:tRNA pseudouridine(38-40) synthase TruA [Gehongia tenuis]MBC8531576.1 tRNA pseudouridine(38-40) synthase TruA [Gehongia tenuis]
MRILLNLEYDGTDYCGWQRQKNGYAVQQAVEEALEKLPGHFSGLTGAGRTDAGVHALGQCAHVDYAGPIPPEKLFLALNGTLPGDVRATASRRVLDGFHARYDALGKTYQYRAWNGTVPSAVFRSTAGFVQGKLDVQCMDRAGQKLVGTHDFSAFQSTGRPVRSAVRTVTELRVLREDGFVVVRISADGFLYNMVRIIAGTLFEIGKGRLKPEVLEDALVRGDRDLLGPTAAPEGLILLHVCYSEAKMGQNILTGREG